MVFRTFLLLQTLLCEYQDFVRIEDHDLIDRMNSSKTNMKISDALEARWEIAMGWTKRKEVLTSYEDIISYLDKENNFHDYRIGNIEHTATETEITVEEVIPGVKVEDSAGLIWDFHFKGVTFFEMIVDVVLGFWIMDVDRGERPNEISFSLLSGIIHVSAEQIELGIPSQEN